MHSKLLNNSVLCSILSHIAATISIQSATSLSTSRGAQTSSSSPSTAQPAATISLIGHSASGELSESTAHIQVSYTYTEHIIKCLKNYTSTFKHDIVYM